MAILELATLDGPGPNWSRAFTSEAGTCSCSSEHFIGRWQPTPGLKGSSYRTLPNQFSRHLKGPELRDTAIHKDQPQFSPARDQLIASYTSTTPAAHCLHTQETALRPTWRIRSVWLSKPTTGVWPSVNQASSGSSTSSSLPRSLFASDQDTSTE